MLIFLFKLELHVLNRALYIIHRNMYSKFTCLILKTNIPKLNLTYSVAMLSGELPRRLITDEKCPVVTVINVCSCYRNDADLSDRFRQQNCYNAWLNAIPPLCVRDPSGHWR